MPEMKNEVRGSSSLGEIDTREYPHPVQLVQGQGELEGGRNSVFCSDQLKLMTQFFPPSNSPCLGTRGRTFQFRLKRCSPV